MLVAIHWGEWLHSVKVQAFTAGSAMAVEDHLSQTLPSDRTSFVFDDTDRPMLQAIESQWGNGRFSAKQLAEIYNSLVIKEHHVKKFHDRDRALQQISVEIFRHGKASTPQLVRTTIMDNIAADMQTEAESQALTKAQIAEQKKADKAAEKQRKADERAAAKAEKAAEKGEKPVGVIGTLVNLLTDGEHRTVDELYVALVESFPDRGEGMKTTVRVQLVRLAKDGKLNICNEDNVDAEGKKHGKRYWGLPIDA